MRGARAWVVAVVIAAVVVWPIAVQANDDRPEDTSDSGLVKTIANATLTPALALTFGVSPDRGIPGDQLTYTATVTNTGANVGLEGVFKAGREDDRERDKDKEDKEKETERKTAVVPTVAAYYDLVEYLPPRSDDDRDGKKRDEHDDSVKWIPIAVTSATQPGYTMFDPPPAAGPMTLALTPIASAGVMYPTTGDPIVGTRITKGSVASWTYKLTIPLAPTQLAFLLDPKNVRAIRNVLHLEMTPRPENADKKDTADKSDKEKRDKPDGSDFARVDFTARLRTFSADVTGTVVTITPPTGAPVDLTVGTLASGASATVTTSYRMPVPAPKAADESDAAYLVRLTTAASTPLVASARAVGTASGAVARSPTPDPTATATLLLPIVRIDKRGPVTADAGTTVRYTIALQNTGTAPAHDLAVDDVFPGGAGVATTGVPAALDPSTGAVAAQASFDIPPTQPVGDLTDTASVTWRDANANPYGPVAARFTTSVTASGVGSTLVLAPAVAGPNVTGSSQTLTATAKDKNGVPIAGLVVHFAVTGPNATSADAPTDASGAARFAYAGATRGDDTAQATATYRGTPLTSNTSKIAWVTPIQPVTTTTVLAQFFQADCSGFFNTPAGTTPAFSQIVPTINFNPPAGTVPHNTSGVGVNTRPFTNITTDLQGNFTGAIVAEGNGFQAALGPLFCFSLVLTGEFTVAAAGDITFNFFSDDGFIMGIGSGATRVSGPLVNPPASGFTAFQGYPIMGAYNQATAPVANTIVVHFPAAGSYPYEVDYKECCAGEVALTMTQGPGRTGVPPTGSLAITPITVFGKPVGQTQTFTIAAMDASGFPIVALPVVLTVTGPNSQQVSGTTDSSGIATLAYRGVASGFDHVQAGASISGMPAVSNIVSVGWEPVPAPRPTIGTVGPADGSAVTAPVPITASFTPPAGQTIASWFVTYRRAGTTTDVMLANATGAPPATLAVFDPTRLPNGVYTITVSATATGGGTEASTTTVAVDGSLKLGRYVHTFRDLGVVIGGIPIEIDRVYDSIDKAVGDFGVGWHIDLSSFHAATGRPLGLGGWSQYNAQCVIGLCLTAFRTSVSHAVTVTWPSGRQEIFDFTPDGGSNIFWTGAAKFTGRPGTTSTLQAVGPTGLDYFADGNLYNGGLVYDPQRFMLTAKDGTAYTIDRNTGLVSAVSRSGVTLTVSASGIASSLGPSIAFARDGSGRITQITGPSGEIVRYTYSGAGDLGSFIDGAGNTVTYTYDAAHDLLGMQGSGGQQLRTVVYGADGRITSVTDGDGHTIAVTNDVAGRQQVVSDATGQLTTVLTYDALGDLLQKDEIFGGHTQTTTYTYDAVGRVLSETDPLGHRVSVEYDTDGNLTALVDQVGRRSTFAYDSFGSTTRRVAPDGTITAAMTYDASGNLTREERADGSAYTYAYDGSGHMTAVTDPSGRVSRMTYDAAGQLATVTEPDGQVASYVTDASGRTTASTVAGATTHFSYDGDGNLVGVTGANGHSWSFTYDALGNRTSGTDPLGHTTSYVYDASDLLLKQTDRNGDVTTYTYDAGGRVLSETLPGGHVTTFTYDPLGRPTSIANEDVRIQYTYDAGGRVLSETASAVGTSALPSVLLNMSYDASDLLVSVSGPEGATTYAYDSASRISAVTDARGGTFNFGYDTLGRLVTLGRPNGVSDSLTYDAANELLSRVSAKGATSVASSAYTYDASGRRVSLTDRNGAHTFTYDGAGRLLTATHPSTSGIPNEQYTYDAVGNRTSSNGSTQLYDGGDRLTTDARFNYTYDAEGRLLSRADRVSGALTTFDWNARGELRAVHRADGTTSSYRYDPLGRRVEINDAGAITRFAYDGSNVRLEYNAANAVVASYATTSGAGAVLDMARSGQTYYFSQDGVGSTTALTDASGAVAGTFAYDAFGQIISAPAVGTAYAFTGQQRDAATGLQYFRARYYDPEAGRFISQDPIQAIVPYIYAANDPVSFSDPTGAQMVDQAELAAQRAQTRVIIDQLSSQLCGAVLGAVLGLGLGPNVMGQSAEQYISRLLGSLPRNWTTFGGRIPDFVRSGQWMEVKNTGSLSNTAQIRDMVQGAGRGNLTVYVRAGTKLSGPLLDAVRGGALRVLRCLPG